MFVPSVKKMKSFLTLKAKELLLSQLNLTKYRSLLSTTYAWEGCFFRPSGEWGGGEGYTRMLDLLLIVKRNITTPPF